MSSNGTALTGAVALCCSATTLLAAAATSFAFCLLVVLFFLCLRFALLRWRWRRTASLLQEQPRPKLGLDAASIAMLPSFPYRRAGADAGSSISAPAECAICLYVLDEGQMVRQLPGCKHVFHQECIDVWLASRASCPVCRGRLAEPERAEDRAAAASTTRIVAVEMLDDEVVGSPSTTTEEAERALWIRPEDGSSLA